MILWLSTSANLVREVCIVVVSFAISKPMHTMKSISHLGSEKCMVTGTGTWPILSTILKSPVLLLRIGNSTFLGQSRRAFNNPRKIYY